MGFRERDKDNPLNIYGPKGLEKVKESIFNLGYFAVDFPIVIHEIDEGIIVENDEYIIETVKTKHNVENLAYSIYEKKKPRFLREKAIELGVKPGPDFGKLHRGIEIEVNGKVIKPNQVLGEDRNGIKLVYSGDTKACEEIISLAKNATLLIHESTYSNSDEEKAHNNFHSTSAQAAKIAESANVKELILTHISTRYTDIGDLKKEALEIFENTKVAHDFMIVNLNKIDKG